MEFSPTATGALTIPPGSLVHSKDPLTRSRQMTRPPASGRKMWPSSTEGATVDALSVRYCHIRLNGRARGEVEVAPASGRDSVSESRSGFCFDWAFFSFLV